MEGSRRHLISLDDLTDSDLDFVVRRAAAFAMRHGIPKASGENGGRLPLAGDVFGIYFRLSSTRTRTAFSSAALRLGAQIIAFGPDDLQTNTGETAEDTGRVFARMLDVLVARTGDEPQEMRCWAAQRRMSVVNAMTATEHPTQALADLTTLQRHFGDVRGLRVLYVGEGNSTAAALALALSRISGSELELRTPRGYGLTADIRERALRHASRHGAMLAETHDMANLPRGVDVIYTTRWRTTGTRKPDPDWQQIFEPFRVTKDLWVTSPKAVFMHDLPAHRGEEVSTDVIDGPLSIVFDQAENKLHSAMAALEWCRHGATISADVTEMADLR
jgi:ornithine carbamoyltransferase